jgi:hypothetical protein
MQKQGETRAGGKTTTKKKKPRKTLMLQTVGTGVVEVGLGGGHGKQQQTRRQMWWKAMNGAAIKIRDHPLFTFLITTLIMVVGVFIGIDSDFTLACERTYDREHGKV